MLKEEERLIYRLKEYSKSDYYPFHMPGHKRNRELGREYENPFSVDITEIHGFDNLHHPEGIIKESMKWAASVYGGGSDLLSGQWEQLRNFVRHLRHHRVRRGRFS